MHTLLVTGSSGLIGSEVVTYFCKLGWYVYGIDNNQRSVFFGPEGDTRWNQERLTADFSTFKHYEADIRDRKLVSECVAALCPDLIVHAAAQPSHDLAASMPFVDFDVNAVGTLNLLEAARQFSPESVFVYMSTNKVYGDGPNRIPLKELNLRWDYADSKFANGIAEDFSIDQSKHSLFGASKLAADIMVQEYGRYFGMRTCCLRCGCLTGPYHSGVELHGFLSYLIRCNLQGRLYKIYGYKGKQVRDNLHSLDVVRFIHAFYENPRLGEVYNLGGGTDNSCSILEAFQKVSLLTSSAMQYEYLEKNREGDHICYVSDLAKIQSHYPKWGITKSLDCIFEEMVTAWHQRQYTEQAIGRSSIVA